MDKHEKRFLSRRVCFLCEARLDRNACRSPYSRCPDEIMAERRRKCLETYKPRMKRRSRSNEPARTPSNAT